MSARRWINIFIFNLLQLTTSILVVFIVIIYGLDSADWGDIITFQVISIPLYTWLIAFVVVMSAIIASVLAYNTGRDHDVIRAKINWLLLNKYSHPIFKQEDQSDSLLSQEIEALRLNMVQMSKDLQELSAAPTFVGEDTKDEIIEGERLRIARELHDSVSQELFAATMMMSAINSTVDEAENPMLKQQIDRVEDVIGSAQTEMRALLLHLRPVELKERTLSEGIEHVLTEFNGKVPIDVVWQLDPDVQLESGIEDHLFRITQEAISNTLRHAKAKRLEVFLTQTHDHVQLKVIDDGKGFDVTSVRQSGNYGLTNMRERVTSMGGTLNINSTAKGTIITINIPKT
ncbi:sensor histidine kinase [Aerococcaceae bacterium DSM 111176]|nr:sensor histidine kinase [Aerococcaceae bacterium DSM 111176]